MLLVHFSLIEEEEASLKRDSESSFRRAEEHSSTRSDIMLIDFLLANEIANFIDLLSAFLKAIRATSGSQSESIVIISQLIANKCYATSKLRSRKLSRSFSETNHVNRTSTASPGSAETSLKIKLKSVSILWLPEWRNWQTRWTQNPVRGDSGVGSIPSSGMSYFSGNSAVYDRLNPSFVFQL